MPSPFPRPTLDRTLHTQRHAIGLALLVGGFLALLLLYGMWGRLRDLRAEAVRPAETEVAMAGFTARVPGDWAAYSRLGDSLLVMQASAEPGAAVAALGVTRAPAYRFRALDTNPAFAVRQLARAYAAAFGTDEAFDVLGVETAPYLPGVPSVRVWFTVGNPRREGRARLFHLDDAQYLFWGLAGVGDPAGRTLDRLLSGNSGAVTVPDVRDAFERPVIHSGRIAHTESRAASEAAARELALADAHAVRAEAVEGAEAADLVPALGHYRKAVRLLASVRRETSLVGTEEAARFDRLAERRRAQVRAWFDLLERAQRMGDTAAARAQAQAILRDATLEGEAEDRLRARAILRALPEPEAK